MNRTVTDERALAGWILGTFHTSVLVLSLLLLLYPRGVLGEVLQGLSTATGLALFVALWLTTSYATRRALRGLDWFSDDPAEMAIFFGRALRWGAVNGVLFLAALGVVLLVNALLTVPVGTVLGGLSIGFFFGIFGTPVALVLGAVVGVTLGAIDIAALRVARQILRRSHG
jgi:hypothetical protein